MDKQSRDSHIPYSEAFNVIAAHTDEHYDVGLANFYLQLRSAEIEIAAGATNERIEELVAHLNADWPYFRQELAITGKVYLNDHEMEAAPNEENRASPDFVPISWGQMQKDSWGYYYEVTDEAVVSVGFEYVGATENDQNGCISYAYTFEHSLDSKLFFTRAHEQKDSVFPHPTVEGATAQLEAKFPDLYSDVNKWIKPRSHNFNRLTNQLTHLVHKYPEICQNEQLATWLALYLAERIKFDRNSPYGVTVQGAIEIVNMMESGEPEIYDLADPYTFDTHIKGIGFSRPDELTDYVGDHAYYLLTIPSGISDPEEHDNSVAYLPTSSTLDIKPRRPLISVAEQLRTARLEMTERNIGDSAIRLVAEEANIDDGLAARIAREHAMLRYEESIHQFFAEMTRFRAMQYTGREAALEVATIKGKELIEIIKKHGASFSPQFIVSGYGIQIPNTSILTDSDEDSMRAQINSHKQLIRPAISIDIIGYIEDVFASVEERENGIFSPLVTIQLKISDESPGLPLIQHPSGKPLAEVQITKSAVICADETSNMEILKLYHIRKRNEAIDVVLRLKGAQKEKRLISQLRHEISQEKEQEMVSLSKVSLVAKLAQLLKETKYQLETLNAIKGLICDSRQVQVTGTAFDNDGKEIKLNDHFVFSLDVVLSAPPIVDEPCLAIRSLDANSPYSPVRQQTPIMYLPIKNITDFKF